VNGSPAVAHERDAVLAYLEDAAHYPGGRASGVAHPSSTTEVAELLRRAGRVLPIGAQSSLTGGATPMGELVITTQRLGICYSVPPGAGRRSSARSSAVTSTAFVSGSP